MKWGGREGRDKFKKKKNTMQNTKTKTPRATFQEFSTKAIISKMPLTPFFQPESQQEFPELANTNHCP